MKAWLCVMGLVLPLLLMAGAARSKPIDLNKLVIDANELLPGTTTALIRGQINCKRYYQLNPKAKPDSCPKFGSIPNPYFYLEPVENDANSRNLYPKVNPSTLKNAIVMFFQAGGYEGHFGYVLLNYRNLGGAVDEWKKVEQGIKEKNIYGQYGKAFRQDTQGFFVFREHRPDVKKEREVPKAYMEHLFSLLKNRLTGKQESVSVKKKVEALLGVLPKKAGAIVRSPSKGSFQNPKLLIDTDAKTVGGALFPSVRPEEIWALRIAFFDNPASPNCRSTMITLLLREASAGFNAVNFIKYLERELLANKSTKVFAVGSQIHVLGTENCPPDKDVNISLATQVKKENPKLTALAVRASLTKDETSSRAKTLVLKIHQCLQSLNRPCIKNLLSKPVKPDFSNKTLNVTEADYKDLLKLMVSTEKVLGDLLTLIPEELKDKKNTTPLFFPPGIKRLRIKKLFEGKIRGVPMKFLTVDNSGSPILRTRVLDVSPVEASRMLRLPRTPGKIRLTITRLYLQEEQSGLTLVGWE